MQEKKQCKTDKTETIFVIILRYEQHLDSSDMEEISKCISWAADICTYNVKNNKIVAFFFNFIPYEMYSRNKEKWWNKTFDEMRCV